MAERAVRKFPIGVMGDKIEELKQTMQHVEQLVLRFEIDMAAGDRPPSSGPTRMLV